MVRSRRLARMRLGGSGSRVCSKLDVGRDCWARRTPRDLLRHAHDGEGFSVIARWDGAGLDLGVAGRKAKVLRNHVFRDRKQHPQA